VEGGDANSNAWNWPLCSSAHLCMWSGAESGVGNGAPVTGAA
jgi:hypothetical protein